MARHGKRDRRNYETRITQGTLVAMPASFFSMSRRKAAGRMRANDMPSLKKRDGMMQRSIPTGNHEPVTEEMKLRQLLLSLGVNPNDFLKGKGNDARSD